MTDSQYTHAKRINKTRVCVIQYTVVSICNQEYGTATTRAMFVPSRCLVRDIFIGTVPGGKPEIH